MMDYRKLFEEAMELVDQLFVMKFGEGVAIANKIADLKKKSAELNLTDSGNIDKPSTPDKEPAFDKNQDVFGDDNFNSELV